MGNTGRRGEVERQGGKGKERKRKKRKKIRKTQEKGGKRRKGE